MSQGIYTLINVLVCFLLDMNFFSFSLLIIASRQLKSVALDLVKESFGDTLYGKAQDCIKALREEVIKVQEEEMCSFTNQYC